MAHSVDYENKRKTLSEVFEEMEDDDEIDSWLMDIVGYVLSLDEDKDK